MQPCFDYEKTSKNYRTVPNDENKIRVPKFFDVVESMKFVGECKKISLFTGIYFLKDIPIVKQDQHFVAELNVINSLSPYSDLLLEIDGECTCEEIIGGDFSIENRDKLIFDFQTIDYNGLKYEKGCVTI